MTKGGWTGILALAAALTACGDDDAVDEPDGAPLVFDAAEGDADATPTPDAPPDECPVPLGQSYVLEELKVMDQGAGMDLTGDGVPDNALYFIGIVQNQGWAESIAAGRSIYLLQLGDWVEPLTPNQDEVAFRFYHALDTDEPLDPANNFGGEGEFLLPAEQLDVSCRPTSEWDEGYIEDRVLHASTEYFKFYEVYMGYVEFANCQFTATISEDSSELSGVMGGVWTACGLSKTVVPGVIPGTLLEFIGRNFPESAPDFDRDGDGAETVVVDTSGVVECHDGPNAAVPYEVITGPDCSCDPRIVDGYTVALEGRGPKGYLVGITDSP